MPSTTLSLPELQNTFRKQFAPQALAASTRKSYSRGWHSFQHFCSRIGIDHAPLPTPLHLVQAYCTHLANEGRTASTIRLHIAAISNRHTRRGVPMTMTRQDIRLILRAFNRSLCLPSRVIFPIDITHITDALKLPRHDPQTVRDTVILVLGTILAVRAAQLCNLHTCDLRPGFDPSVPNGLAVYIRRQKNDPFGKGRWPRVAPGSSRHTCPITLVSQYMRIFKIKNHARCSAHSGSHCSSCPHLFQRLSRTNTHRPLSTAMITAAVRSTLNKIGVDPSPFSSCSLCKGGLTITLNAGLTEDLRTLQSGHHSTANRLYETTSHKAYAFSSAFQL